MKIRYYLAGLTCTFSLMSSSFALNSSYSINPTGRMVPSNTPNLFYGITGANNGGDAGDVYSYNSSTHSYNIIAQIPSIIGSPVVESDGSVYVLSSKGGEAGDGVLYAIVNGSVTIAHTFNTSSGDGSNPNSITMIPDGRIFGTTLNGGSNGNGTIFQYNPQDGLFITTQSFSSTLYGSTIGLTYANGNLYGVTKSGGSAGAGVLYKYDYSYGSITILHNFTGGGTDGAYPADTLTTSLDGKVLMGTTLWGSSQSTKYTTSSGSTFSYSTLTNTYHVVWIDNYLQPTSPVQSTNGLWYQAVLDGNDGWDMLTFADDGSEQYIGPKLLWSGPNSTNNQGRNFQNIAINGLTFNSADGSFLATQQWGGANDDGYINQFILVNWWPQATDVYDFQAQ